MHVIFAAAVFLTCSQQHVVDVLQQQRSRSIPPRPNTLTLSCTLPCNPSESCHDRTVNETNGNVTNSSVQVLQTFLDLGLMCWSEVLK